MTFNKSLSAILLCWSKVITQRWFWNGCLWVRFGCRWSSADAEWHFSDSGFSEDNKDENKTPFIKWNCCNKGHAFRKALLFWTAWENLLTLHTSFLLVLCCINLDNVWHLFYQLPARGKTGWKLAAFCQKKEGLQMETLVVWRFFTVGIHPFTSLPNWWCWWKTSSLFKGH